MMTRGRFANHASVQVVGDGELDSVVRLESVAPPTPTEVLESVLARGVLVGDFDAASGA